MPEGSGSSGPTQPMLEAAEAMVDLALAQAVADSPQQQEEGTRVCSAAVLAAAYVCKARLAGRAGDMDACRSYADMALAEAAACGGSRGGAGAASAVAAAAHMLLGKALFQLREFAAARQAFESVLGAPQDPGMQDPESGSSLSVTGSGSIGWMLGWLAGVIRQEVVDTGAAEKGVAACGRKLDPEAPTTRSVCVEGGLGVAEEHDVVEGGEGEDKEGCGGAGEDYQCPWECPGNRDTLDPRTRYTVAGVQVRKGGGDQVWTMSWFTDCYSFYHARNPYSSEFKQLSVLERQAGPWGRRGGGGGVFMCAPHHLLAATARYCLHPGGCRCPPPCHAAPQHVVAGAAAADGVQHTKEPGADPGAG